MPKLKYDQYPFDSRSQIRLLQFDNSAFGSWQWSFTPPITITVGAKAEAACRFIATSYEWGSPDDIAPFTIGGEETTLRCNLIHFLNTLSEVQHPDIKTPVYWIDSICINQDDKEEKANQIGLLRDIYSSASCVLSWLGPMGNGSNVAMKYLSGVNIEAGDSVHALLNRRYWTRLWMVQEVVLGKRWYIACGTDVIDGDDLARRFKSPNSHVTRRVFQWTKSRAYKLIRERQRFRKSGPRALVDLMLRFYELDAEFKVDKIRALLGLSKPGTTGNIHGFLTRFVGATGDFDLVKVITHNIYREICWLTGLGRSRDVLVFVASMLHRRTDKNCDVFACLCTNRRLYNIPAMPTLLQATSYGSQWICRDSVSQAQEVTAQACQPRQRMNLLRSPIGQYIANQRGDVTKHQQRSHILTLHQLCRGENHSVSKEKKRIEQLL
jgi:hypothetical protein